MSVREAQMRIVYVCGMLDVPLISNRVWDSCSTSFMRAFTGSEFVITHSFYVPLQREKIRSYAEQLLAEYDDDTPTLLFGHSLGGVVARSIATRFKKSAVLMVATINTPHRLNRWLGLEYETCAAPVVSFSGSADWVVPIRWTHCPGARNLTLDAVGHFSLLRSSDLQAQIVRIIKEIIDGCGKL